MTTKSAPMCTCGRRYEVIEQWGHEPTCPVATWIPPTKRTHGPCTCIDAYARTGAHRADCPSLYPLQPQPGDEPDALTRLARWVRENEDKIVTEFDADQALALIAEAREEQRKAAVRAKNEGLEVLAMRMEHSRDRAKTMAKTEHVLSTASRDWQQAARVYADIEELARSLKDSEP